MVIASAPELAGSGPSGVMSLLWLVPVIPLAAAAINLFVGRRLGRWAGWLAVGAMLASFALAVAIVIDLVSLPGEGRLVVQHVADWITVGAFRVSFDLRLDVLSATMILVVTGIGSLIHIYAVGYMEGDPRFGRFFAYLNLFVFFMLVLVLGANYLVLYLGWEGVGLCSYLLIGFWFDKVDNANAAKKAFVTTRVGDTAMLIGLALIISKFGTLDFEVIFGSAAATISQTTATAIALLLFAGAIGKSAQIPLHVWLPDAMAGPTPVSALIHAATMVTAGVYLMIRSFPLLELSETALTVVAVVGLITLLFAGLCAIGQDDIKRVLAYSTVSQLGYMFVAVGLRAYSAALFMLVAHAFYKALMFLGAGSVMHGMHEETDMKKMGGLLRRMPLTGWTFIVGSLALAGLPPLAGFFAKDHILEVANHTGNQWIWVLGTIGAFISAFYMGRLIFLTFFGRPRTDQAERAHESPWIMTAPLLVLAVGAAGLGIAFQRSVEGSFTGWSGSAIPAPPHGEAGLALWMLSSLATVIAVGTLAAAWLIYASGRVDWMALRERLAPIQRLFANGWYIDEYYSTIFVVPGKAAAAFVAYVVDLRIIDGLVDGIGGATRRLAEAGRKIQTGYVRTYAAAVFLGAVLLLVFVGLRL